MAATGNALERYHGRLMIAVTADGPLEAEIPEMTRMFLQEITVYGPEEMEVRFQDGTITRIRI